MSTEYRVMFEAARATLGWAAQAVKQHVWKTTGNVVKDARISLRKYRGTPIQVTKVESHDYRLRGEYQRVAFKMNTMTRTEAQTKQRLAHPPTFGNLGSVKVHDKEALIGDIHLYMRAAQSALVAECVTLLDGKAGSLMLDVTALMYKHTNQTYSYALFSSEGYDDVLPNTSSIQHFLDNAATEIEKEIEAFNQNGSGVSFVNLSTIFVKFLGYPAVGHTGGGDVPIYKCLSQGGGCVNIRSENNDCFENSILASLHDKDVPDNKNRSKNYDSFRKNYCWDGIQRPTPVTDCAIWEKNNPGYQVVVFKVEGPKDFINAQKCDLDFIMQYPPCKRPTVDDNKTAILLMISHPDAPEENHYVGVYDIGKVRGKSSHKGKRTFCPHCYRVSKSCSIAGMKELEIHMTNCLGDDVILNLPTSDSEKRFVAFKNHKNKQHLPYVAYADIEAFNASVEVVEDMQKAREDKKTGDMQTVFCIKKEDVKTVHVVSAARYVIIGPDGKMWKNRVFKHVKKDGLVKDGESVMEEFVKQLSKDAHLAKYLVRKAQKMQLTDDDEKAFERATTCHICEKDILNPKDKVRDHDHAKKGYNYRGAAHSKCNIAYNFSTQMPVFFHNAKNYDNHFAVRALADMLEPFDAIAMNSEKFMAVTWKKGNVSIRDSCLHLTASLESLVETLKKDKYAFPITRAAFKRRFTPKVIDMLIGKGVFPYLYHDRPERLELGYPPLDVWVAEGKTEKEYESGLAVYEATGCKSFGDYHDLYLETDVYLLSDVFEAHRKNMELHFNLDPAWYYSLPGNAWDVLLKVCERTGQPPIELLTDERMLLLVERCKRGGFTAVIEKYAKANNPEVPGYDPTQPTTWIEYYDANNLYGGALSEPLPYGGWHWQPELCKLPTFLKWLEGLEAAGTEGAFVEISGYWPDHTHDALIDLSPLVEARRVYECELSELTNNLLDGRNMKGTKLVADLCPKERYVAHFRMLKYAMGKGFVVTRVHNVLGFKQARIFKPFVDHVTALRTAATSTVEQDMLKLTNNAVFGKTIEDTRKHNDFTTVSTNEQLRTARKNKTVMNTIPVGKYSLGLMMKKRVVRMDKPIALGVTVLDLSKLHMLGVHHDVMVPHFGHDNIRLLYTDTDSFVYKIQCDDFKEKLRGISAHMDLSNIQEDSYIGELRDSTNAKVLGKMKDETQGVPIDEFVALAPKMYAFSTVREIKKDKGTELKKSKGTLSDVVNKDIRLEHYKHVLFNQKPLTVNDIKTMNRMERGEDSLRDELPQCIRSREHHLYTIAQDRVALSPVDTKRYWLTTTRSVPFGHCSIPSLRFAQPGWAKPLA